MDLLDDEDEKTGSRILVASAKSKEYKKLEKRALLTEGRIFGRLQGKITRNKATSDQIDKFSDLNDKLLMKNMSKSLVPNCAQ